MTQDHGSFAPKGLSSLLRSDSAWEYYQGLPDYVRQMISQRSGNIQSEDELRRYAENLLAGDR